MRTALRLQGNHINTQLLSVCTFLSLSCIFRVLYTMLLLIIYTKRRRQGRAPILALVKRELQQPLMHIHHMHSQIWQVTLPVARTRFQGRVLNNKTIHGNTSGTTMSHIFSPTHIYTERINPFWFSETTKPNQSKRSYYKRPIRLLNLQVGLSVALLGMVHWCPCRITTSRIQKYMSQAVFLCPKSYFHIPLKNFPIDYWRVVAHQNVHVTLLLSYNYSHAGKNRLGLRQH
jgi:hypothetical protein